MIATISIIDEISTLIEEWEPRLAVMEHKIITRRRNSQNRTIKQILGHTVDSTTNNIHRIVHLQNLASPLVFPNYASFGNNDRWIAIQDYQNENWINLIQLWKYSLLHLCHVINNVDESKLQNEWLAGPGEVVTLAVMINDFTRHLKLHLLEIDDLINEN